MQNELNVYCGKAKERMNPKFNTVEYELSLDADTIKSLKSTDGGKIRLTMKPLKSPDQYGMTHTIKVNTYFHPNTIAKRTGGEHEPEPNF